jgi:hypothetical protein
MPAINGLFDAVDQTRKALAGVRGDHARITEKLVAYRKSLADIESELDVAHGVVRAEAAVPTQPAPASSPAPSQQPAPQPGESSAPVGGAVSEAAPAT